MSEFYSALMLTRHVSHLTGPSSEAFYKLYLQIWYVVIRVLLDTSSRYKVVGTTYISLQKKIYSFRHFDSLEEKISVNTFYNIQFIPRISRKLLRHNISKDVIESRGQNMRQSEKLVKYVNDRRF